MRPDLIDFNRAMRRMSVGVGTLMTATGNNDRERVLAATDIVRLIGEHVQLRPKGREFAGLCPFHDDKNPSMQVSPQKQIYKCFSCGAGGTCYDFVMGYHKLSFPEALKMLADRSGIELTPFKPGKGQGDKGQGESGGADRRKRLLAANELALAFFQQQLNAPAGEQARQYIARRGISSEMVELFQLGCAPHHWHALAEAVAAKRWDKPAFENAGLIANGSRGWYDKLRHRLIFPIADDMGRVIAFGGRTLPGNTLDDPTVDAKYLNSPETLLFNKSRTLFGLHLAKKDIIQSKTAIIVEGYTDVIACHQHSRRNVVAALGTAFTQEHAEKLRRFCEKVVLVFDGDEAGHKAADRAVEVLLNGEIDVSVAILPDGQDPDELLATPGGEALWDTLVEQAPGAMQYLLSQFEHDMTASSTMAGQQDVATAFLTRLARHDIAGLPGIRRALIVARIAQQLHMPEHEVLAQLKGLKPRVFAPAAQRARPGSDHPGPISTEDASLQPEWYENDNPERHSSSKLRAVALAQRQLVASLLRDNTLFDMVMPDGADFCEAVTPGDLTGQGRVIFQLLHDRLADGQSLTLHSVLMDLTQWGMEAEHRWLTQADVELDPHLGDDPARLKQVFLHAAQAIRKTQRNQVYEEDRRIMVRTASPAHDPLLLAGQAARLAEQRRNEHDPGRIARGPA